MIGKVICVAVASFFASGVTAAFALDDKTLVEVSLQCPGATGGTLQLTSMNRLGQRDRITIVYADDIAVRLELAVAETDGDFDTYFTSTSPESETDADAKEMNDSVLARYGVLRRGVCLAPQRERDRYFRELERLKRTVER